MSCIAVRGLGYSGAKAACEGQPINAIGNRHAHASVDEPRMSGRAPHPPGCGKKIYV